jgi:hypothetical protein
MLPLLEAVLERAGLLPPSEPAAPPSELTAGVTLINPRTPQYPQFSMDTSTAH